LVLLTVAGRCWGVPLVLALVYVYRRVFLRGAADAWLGWAGYCGGSIVADLP